MSVIKALVFDLDDTLLYGEGAASIAAACHAVAAADAGLDAEALQAANTKVWSEYWPRMQAAWTLGKLSTAELTLGAWTRTLSACNCHRPELVLLAQRIAGERLGSSYRLFDDVAPLFEALAGRLPLALITNGASDLQREKLRHTDLERWFDAIVISGEAGCAKPDPRIFRLALENLGASEDGAWYVGDNPVNDIAGAKDAGLTAVWLNRDCAVWPYQDVRPDHEIGSLAEMPSLL